jgi:hypothetical protein
LLKKSKRRRVVLRNALSTEIKIGEVILGERIAVVGSFALPVHSRLLVSGNADSTVVHIAEIGLRARVSSFGSLAEIAQRLGRILGNISEHSTSPHSG